MDDNLQALREIMTRWDKRIQEARQHSQNLNASNVHQGYYYRGIAEGLALALHDLQAALPAPSEVTPPASAASETFARVEMGSALECLKRAGWSAPDLRGHADNSFSLFFPALQTVTLDERLRQLIALADVVILDQGRLPNSSKAYLDFAFRSPPHADR